MGFTTLARNQAFSLRRLGRFLENMRNRIHTIRRKTTVDRIVWTVSLLYFTNYAAVIPTSGAMPGLKAFVAAVFGGIGSIPGAVIGAFIIGICENIIKGLGWTTFSDAFTFALLIIILIVKPTGLFGEKANEKV